MRFSLLGPLTVADCAGNALAVAGPRLRVLLATLLLHANLPVSVEQLAEMVWDGSPPPGAVATLRSYVRRLRRALGDDATRIVARDPGYLIQVDQSELDVVEFDTLCRITRTAARAGDWADAAAAAARALRLWRAAPLVDVASEALRGEFALRLDRLRLQLVEDRFDAGLRLGQHEELIPQLFDETALHPVQERLHGQLMVALAATGRRAQALDAYRHARHTLVRELGVEPGPELREIHRQILVGEAPGAPGPADGVRGTVEIGEALPDGSAAKGAPPVSIGPGPEGVPGAAAPRQLPAAARHFTGRRDELAQIVELLQPARSTDVPGGGVVISTIDGMGGVGKTAFAVHAAYWLAGRCPDGQLFVDLHGYTKGYPPREPGEALGALLRTLGVPATQIPAQLDERAAVYRQRLAGTRTLILLDNALDEAQVRPLLPGAPGCLVLITSRRRLKGLHDAHIVSLDVLPETDALRLLRSQIGPARAAADPALDEIVDLCGRLPLALRITGALLRHRPTWTPGYLAGLLRNEHRPLAALADGDHDLCTVLDLSYRGLGEHHRLLFRRLALIPGPDLDAFATAALLDVDPAAAAGLLEDLVDHSLLIEYAQGRYRLHDLIRVHARTLANGDSRPERDRALDRLLSYYARAAHCASMLIARHPRGAPDGPAPVPAPALTSPETGRAWLRAERENLEAAHAHASARALDDYAVTLAAGLAEILSEDGPFTRAIEIHQSAAATAERRGWAAAHAGLLMELGSMRRLTGDLGGAAHAATQALDIWRAAGDRDGEATALNELGNVRSLTGDYQGAVAAHARALDIWRTGGHRHGEATALIELGRMRLLTGDFREAADTAARGLEIFRAIGHRHGEADSLIELGRIRLVTGDLSGAGEALTQALDIYRAIGHRHGQANALVELANVRRLTGELTDAADAAAQALEIYGGIGHRHGQASALAAMARAWLVTGDLSGAGEALTQALDIYRAIGHRHGQANALVELANVRRLTGELTDAADAAAQALEIYGGIGHRYGEASALVELGRVRQATGDPSGAGNALARALAIYRATGNRNGEAWALNFHAAAVAAMGDLPRALARYRQALAMNRELNKPDDEAVAHEGLGESYLSLGEIDQGTAHFHKALEIYERLGMAPDVDRVRHRLTKGKP